MCAHGSPIWDFFPSNTNIIAIVLDCIEVCIAVLYLLKCNEGITKTGAFLFTPRHKSQKVILDLLLRLFKVRTSKAPWTFLKRIFTHWKQSCLITQIYIFWVFHYTVSILCVVITSIHTVSFQRLGTNKLQMKSTSQFSLQISLMSILYFHNDLTNHDFSQENSVVQNM